MYARIVHRRTIQNSGVAVAAITATALLLQYPDAVYNGMQRGMAVCTSVILPTLFPFMLLAGWLADSSLCRQPGRCSQAMARRLFGLPGCCAPAILLSLVGGYPAGMIAISRLYRQGQIQQEELRRMSAFCLCGGPGFIVGTVGIGLMGSAHAGWLLYAAQALTAVSIGILLGRGHHTTESAPIPAPPRPFARMVADTCQALLTMCGFVTTATMVLSLSEGLGIPHAIARLTPLSASTMRAITAGLLEVSSGCIAVANIPLAPLWLSLCLGWGGLSIHGQLDAILSEERVICRRFWWWRLLQGGISGGIAMGLFYLFPPQQSTGTSTMIPLPFSVSASASYMLLGLCFLTMLCFSEKKTGKTL